MSGLLLTVQPASAVVFSDGTFANGDWTATVTTQTGGASQSVIGQVGAGGSPGAWREATHSFVGAGVVRVYHERQGMSFDPSTLASGEALLLDYSEDRIEISPPFGGAAVGAAPALQQDGIIYAGPDINYTNTTWGTVALTGLSAADFTPYGGVGHPDFASTGSPITFGYYRTNSNTGGSSFTITHGIDNWSFTTTTASIGEAIRESKVSDTAGGFTGTLVTDDRFGEAVAGIGDVDGDGIGDIAVYEREDTPGTDAGAVWTLLSKPDGTVKSAWKILHQLPNPFPSGAFLGELVAGDRFGVGLEGLGDLNYDGIPDLAAGAPGDDTFGTNRGAVWILFLKGDGTVRSEHRISNGGTLPANAAFGRSVARLGDLDGDGVTEIAVGASTAQAVYVLFLDPDGSVWAFTEISQTTLPALGLVAGEGFGGAAASPGDVDGDGIPDLAVGALLADEGPTTDVGAVYVFLLNADGTPKAFQKLTSASVSGGLSGGDRFGAALEEVGDLDGDGVPDLAVGAVWDDTAGTNAGSIHVLFLNADGSAKSSMEITEGVGGFGGNLDGSDEFGSSLARVQGGPTGPVRLAVGAQSDDDGGTNHGAVWLVDLAGETDAPLCGNGWVEDTEECDDGNTVSADTCSASCEIEQVLFLRGSASGGNVQATVSGELVNVATGGQTPEQVLAALAAAIEANPTLQGLGVEATSAGQVLYTTGAITASTTSDAGLTLGERDDLVLEGSSLDHPYFLPVDQNVPSLPLTVAATGGFALPADLFTRPDFGHAPIVCARQSTAASVVTTIFPVTIVQPGPDPQVGVTQAAGVKGTGPGSDVRCTGALSGFLYGYTSFFFDLAPVGAGGIASFRSPNTLHPTVIARLAGAPWTLHRAWADDPTVTTITYSTGYTTQLVTPAPQWRRGIDARRADGVGVINPVAPLAFQFAFQQGDLSWSQVGEWARFAELRLRFVPEPLLGLGLAAGVLALAGLAWHRRYTC